MDPVPVAECISPGNVERPSGKRVAFGSGYPVQPHAHELAWEEGGLDGEPLEETLAGQRCGWDLVFGEPREVAGQEAGPDGVGVGGGAEARCGRSPP